MRNTNVREFMGRYGQKLVGDVGEHCNILNFLNSEEFRLAMFLDSAERMIYFKDKRTGERISLVEVATGI